MEIYGNKQKWIKMNKINKSKQNIMNIHENKQKFTKKKKRETNSEIIK